MTSHYEANLRSDILRESSESGDVILLTKVWVKEYKAYNVYTYRCIVQYDALCIVETTKVLLSGNRKNDAKPLEFQGLLFASGLLMTEQQKFLILKNVN